VKRPIQVTMTQEIGFFDGTLASAGRIVSDWWNTLASNLDGIPLSGTTVVRWNVDGYDFVMTIKPDVAQPKEGAPEFSKKVSAEPRRSRAL